MSWRFLEVNLLNTRFTGGCVLAAEEIQCGADESGRPRSPGALERTTIRGGEQTGWIKSRAAKTTSGVSAPEGVNPLFPESEDDLAQLDLVAVREDVTIYRRHQLH